MGQKVHPGGLRVGVIHDWKSNWYTTNKDFKDALLEDIKIREHINRKLGHAGLSDILIRKDKQRITIELVQLEEAPARPAKKAKAPATTETTEPATEAKPKASRRKKAEEAAV